MPASAKAPPKPAPSASAAASAAVEPPAPSASEPPRSKPAPRATVDDAPPATSAAPVAKPAASQEVVWDRPEGTLQRGKWAAPRWAVLGLGIVVAVLAGVYFIVRLRRIRAQGGA